MNDKNNRLLLKIGLAGILTATLIYLFHPYSNLFSITYNGEPLEGPFTGLTSFVLIAGTFVFTLFLVVMIMLGSGIFLFLLFSVFGMIALCLAAPVLLPIALASLIIVFISRI